MDLPLQQHNLVFSREMFHHQPANLAADLPENQQAQSTIQACKRTRKAPTMSVKAWKPCEGLIKQLYANEGKSYKELREIVNEKFNLSATERQYKVKIQKMKLERNSKPGERNAVVRHIQHRKANDKKRSHVRIRGHDISAEKLARWTNEVAKELSFISTNPPSPLPSCVSIYTDSRFGSPRMAKSALSRYRLPRINLTEPNDGPIAVIQRLLRFNGVLTHDMEPGVAGSLLNDLQIVLDSQHIKCERTDRTEFACLPETSAWNPVVEEDITHIRNIMNLGTGIELENPSTATTIGPFNPNSLSKPRKSKHRHAAWLTPYGRVHVSFWTVSGGPRTRIAGAAPKEVMDKLDQYFAASVVVLPSRIVSSSFNVKVDFTPHLDPGIKITYQAVIPNDSEVFKIITRGNLEALIEAFEQGTASLTDRDEDGRSLLNYATHNAHVDICRFLIDRNADVNSIESSLLGTEYIGPPLGYLLNLAEVGEEMRVNMTQCSKILLEAGADPSIERHAGHGVWLNGLIRSIHCDTVEGLKYLLDLGQPFLDSMPAHRDLRCCEREISPLQLLANNCGYFFNNSLHVVDKAILIMRRGADVSYRNCIGDTVLHVILRCKRLHEIILKADRQNYSNSWALRLSVKAPKDLLMAFISAGVDVYAENDGGETPSIVAWKYGRMKEWKHALTECGFDASEVLSSLTLCQRHKNMRERQKSKMTFAEYCQKREREPQIIEQDGFDGDQLSEDEKYGNEIWDSEESESEEDAISEEGTAYTEHHDENPSNFLDGEPTNYDTRLDIKNSGNTPEDVVMSGTDFQLDVGTDSFSDDIIFDFNTSIPSLPDAMDRFFNFDDYFDGVVQESDGL